MKSSAIRKADVYAPSSQADSSFFILNIFYYHDKTNRKR